MIMMSIYVVYVSTPLVCFKEVDYRALECSASHDVELRTKKRGKLTYNVLKVSKQLKISKVCRKNRSELKNKHKKNGMQKHIFFILFYEFGLKQKIHNHVCAHFACLLQYSSFFLLFFFFLFFFLGGGRKIPVILTRNKSTNL